MTLVLDASSMEVVDLSLNSEVELPALDFLLEECGLSHFHWALLCHLAGYQDVHTPQRHLLDLDARRMPSLALDVRHGLNLAITQPLCALRVNPFDSISPLFISYYGPNDTIWYGQPVMVALVETKSQMHDVAYIRWLGLPLSGAVRWSLPIPAHLPVFQWEKTQMGLYLSHPVSQSYSVVNI